MKQKILYFFSLATIFCAFQCHAQTSILFKEEFSTTPHRGELKHIEQKENGLSLKIGNFVNNASFEESHKAPLGFFIYDTTKGALDPTVAHSGKHSVRLDGDTSIYLHPNYFVQVKEGVSWYVASVWVKPQYNIEHPEDNSVQMRVWGKDKEKKNVLVHAASMAGSHDWVRLVQPIEVKKDVLFISSDTMLRQKNSTDGEKSAVWIDSVQIEEGKRPTEFTEKYYREGIYTSPEISVSKGGIITWKAEMPSETSIEVRWKNGANTEALEDSKWIAWSSISPISFSAEKGSLLQIQVRLLSKGRGLETPIFSSLTVAEKQ
jgi:hypothetical protein